MSARTWLPRAAGAAALTLAALVTFVGPAAAIQVVPTEKSFSTAIDAVPTWERENGCDPVEKPGPKFLRKMLLATYGPVGSNIVRPCTAADSGHEEGRALDWMVSVRDPAQKAMGDAFVAWLQAPDGYGNPEAMARRLGISYVIWNNRTWRAYDPDRGWTDYNGCLAKSKQKKVYDNTCHRTHVHISFSWDGALKRTSYYTGYVACPAPLPVVPPAPTWPPAAPSVPTTPTVPTVPTVPPVPPVPPVVVTEPVLPLPPARLLGTQTGVGTPGGKCRVHPDVRLDLAVLGQGGVPLEGVSAVGLRVTIVRPDAAPELRVWPAGQEMPVDPVSLDPTLRVAEVTVPLGAGGQVSLQLAGAMAHLRVDVLGYVAAPPPTA